MKTKLPKTTSGASPLEYYRERRGKSPVIPRSEGGAFEGSFAHGGIEAMTDPLT